MYFSKEEEEEEDVLIIYHFEGEAWSRKTSALKHLMYLL